MNNKLVIGDRAKIVNNVPDRNHWTEYTLALVGKEVEIIGYGYSGLFYEVKAPKDGLMITAFIHGENLEHTPVNPTNPHKNLIVAWANGAKIEIWQKPWRHYGGWKLTKNPKWLPTSKYRIAISKEVRQTTLKEIDRLRNTISEATKKINALKESL